MIKMLTVLEVSNCECKSYSHVFSKTINIYIIFIDQNFNDTLTNDIVSNEQLGPDRRKTTSWTMQGNEQRHTTRHQSSNEGFGSHRQRV